MARVTDVFLFQIGQRYYRQIVGIPQGSVLSVLLCSFFYGDLERTRLNILDDPKSVRILFLPVRASRVNNS
jgi:hypothetical protein